MPHAIHGRYAQDLRQYPTSPFVEIVVANPEEVTVRLVQPYALIGLIVTQLAGAHRHDLASDFALEASEVLKIRGSSIESVLIAAKNIGIAIHLV